MALDVQALSREDYWRALCPDHAITPRPFAVEPPAHGASEAELAAAHDTLLRDGYLVLAPLITPAEASRLVMLVQTIRAAGLPPVFALVYDSVWQLVQRLPPLFERFLGPSPRLVSVLWIWHVDGKDEKSGWPWHRDRLTGSGFYDEAGKPSVLTVWIPFTDVSREQACIEVLPQSCDPNFPDKLANQVVPPELAPRVRALPVPAGSPIAWNVQVLHRGGPFSADPRAPRISLGIYLQSCDSSAHEGRTFGVGGELPLIDRLGMIGGMIHYYRARYDFDAGLLEAVKPWALLQQLVSARRGNR